MPSISRASSASSSAAGLNLSHSALLLISVTKVVWTFPSPMWPKVVSSRSYLSDISCAFLITSGILVGGIPRSSDMATSLLPGLIRESVGTSLPLASIISPALAGSSLQVNSCTPCFLHISPILSISLSTVSLAPSDSIISMASTPLMSLSIAPSTTFRAYLSIISHAVSWMPEPIISVTVAPAAKRSLKIARARALYSGVA